MFMSEFLSVKRHGFLVRTKHRSGSPPKKQPFNGLVECGSLEAKCVVDVAEVVDTARGIDVQLAVAMMDFRNTDERRAEETVPGADIWLARTNLTEVNIARGTLLPGPAMTYGQPAELCKHFGRWMA